MTVDASTADAGATTAPAPAVNAPAWLHVAVSWSLALVGLAFMGVFVLVGKPIPEPFVIVVSVAGGGALGLTNPMQLRP